MRVAVSDNLAQIPEAREALGQLDRHPWLDWTVVSSVEGELRLENTRYEAAIVAGELVTVRSLPPSMRLIALFGVGFENVDLDACRARGIYVTNTPDAVRRPMASGAVAMLLALTHYLPVRDRLVRAGQWQRANRYVGGDLAGRTVGFVGYGNIGQEIARLLQPWDVTVLAYTRSGQGHTRTDVTFCSLQEVLSQADAIFVACPLTTETRGMIGKDELALMKRSAYIVNVARGPIIDETALLDALEHQRLGGAALDVFTDEPLSARHPLTAMVENVILAPHSIGHTRALVDRAVSSACAAVAAVHGERVPEHVVAMETR